MILCIFKLIFSIAKPLNKPFKDNSQGRRVNQSLGSSSLKGFESSFRSHPLWVTLYVVSGTDMMIITISISNRALIIIKAERFSSNMSVLRVQLILMRILDPHWKKMDPDPGYFF